MIRVQAHDSQRWFLRGLNLLIREMKTAVPGDWPSDAPEIFRRNRRRLDDLLKEHVVGFDGLHICEDSIVNLEALVEELAPASGVGADKPAARPAQLAIYEKLATYPSIGPSLSTATDRASVAAALNDLVLPFKFDDAVYDGLSETVRSLCASCPTGDDLLILNRLMLEETFPGVFRHWRSRRPLHIVNTALNLVRGEDLAWQERKAESFWMSPLHCGSNRLGLRRSHHYGGRVSLATAITISGAAASPNMGHHTSPAVSFLLTLLNVRLGWWLGNPGIWGCGRRWFQDTFHRTSPRLAIKPIIFEALGLTNEKRSYVYLSDGGHFENLGLYEMVRRRCRFIVVCDAGQDSRHAFQDLGNAIRKIRVDLGVPIDIRERHIYPKEDPRHEIGKYCAVGTIHYSKVDRDGVDGKILYLKPAFYGDEPVDVYNYGVDHVDFPHEPTANQFFGESQFESYRMLGQHIIETIGQSATTTVGSPLEVFIARAEAYLAAEKPRGARSRTQGGAPPVAPTMPPPVVDVS